MLGIGDGDAGGDQLRQSGRNDRWRGGESLGLKRN
jgi:hypothetical protein